LSKDAVELPDGRALAYERRGTGPTLVCHPGGPGFTGLYFGDLAGLDEQLELIILDPRGTGESSRPADPKAYLIEHYVEDVEALRANLGLDGMALLGHSHGGVVAQAYAATHPDRVAKLILANTLCRFSPEQQEAMQQAMLRYEGEEWYADAVVALEQEQAAEFASDEEMSALVARELPFYFHRFTPEARAWVDSLRGDVLNADTLRFFNAELFTTFDTRPLLERITAPTLILYAEQDFITGPACARDLIEGIPGARVVALAEAGHMSWIEQPDAFRRAILGFLAVS